MSLSAVPVAPTRNVLLRIAPFVFVVFCTYLAVAMPLASLPLQVHDVLGFGNFTVGIAVGMQSLTTLLTRPFAGSLCDGRGAKFGVLLGGGTSILAAAVYLLSTSSALGVNTSLGVLLIGRAILGVGESLLMTGSLAWGIGAVGGHNTGKVMVWVGIGMYAAIAAGAPLGVQLMSHQGVIGGFAAVSVGTIVAAVVATAPAIFIPSVPAQAGTRLPFMNVARRIAPYGVGLALATIGFGAIAAFAALDFQSKGWTGAGFALTGFGVAYIFTRLVLGHWPDRFGGARVGGWSLVVACAGQVMLWLAPDAGVAFAGAILTGIGFSLVFPAFGIEAVKQVPTASRGAALGAYVAFFDVGIAAGGPITGLIAGTFGYPAVFAAGALGTVTALLAAWRASKLGATNTQLPKNPA